MTDKNNKTGILLSLLVSAVFASACAMPPDDPEARAEYEEINDPLEQVNRGIFAFNRGLDKILFKPLAKAYLYIPEPGRDAVHNLLANMRSPVIFGNDLMQGKVERAGNTLGRFLINTTIGIGGLFDPASHIGLPAHDEDFGQTLAVWGSSSGPYIMIPIFGPSNPRDIVGKVVDSFIDPFNYVFENNDVEIEAGLSRTVLSGIDDRSRVIEVLDEIESTSLDFYATIRSLHRQRRTDEINDGAASDKVPGPSFMTDYDDGRSEKASLGQE